MKRRAPTDNTIDYWPGYVDALTNVVLNLLFLISILAIGVFALGLEASRQVLPAALDRFKELPTSGTRAAVMRIYVSDSDQDPHDATQRVLFERVRLLGEGQQELTLGFDRTMTRIDERDRRELLPQLQHLVGANPVDLKVWASADTQDPILRRAAYLRVMAVRDVLMQAGVEPQRIHTRLLVGHTGRASGQSVFIVIEQELTDEK